MLLYRFIDKNLLAPPYRLLPAVVFIVALLSFLLDPHSAFYTFALGDPDDYMRLNETINWLQWAGWYDLSHPRLGLGAHTVIHWARLLDVPLALMMKPFLVDWGYRNSAMLAALIEPLILLGFMLALVPAMARPFVGRGNASLAVLFVPFAPMLFFNFTPGRVDHHNWEILIAGVGLMALPRLLLCRGGWKAGVFSACAFAVGLWISPEIVPCLLLALGCLALFPALRGGFALRNAAIFGFVLAAATAVLLPAALPVSEWHSRTISWFSTGYVIFAALAGVVLVTAWLLGGRTENRILRLVLVAALAGFAALAFFDLVPDALNGPFAGYDDFDATITLDNIGEAQPLMRAFQIDPYNHLTILRAGLYFLRIVFPLLAALVACVFVTLTKSRRARLIGAVYAICIGGTFALALLAQSRMLWFAEMFQLAPLVYLCRNFWSRLGRGWTASQLNWAAVLAFLVLAPLPVFAAPRIARTSWGMSEPTSACFLKPAAEYIAGPWGYVTHPYTILAGANEGPELLFRTPHNVLGGNFDIPANKDIFDFFSARDDATAMAVLRKWHVYLVLTCRNAPPFYAGTDHPQIGKNAFLKLESDGKLHLVSSLTSPTLVEKLVNGQPPTWLVPVEIPTSKDYLLFEVHLPDEEKKAK